MDAVKLTNAVNLIKKYIQINEIPADVEYCDYEFLIFLDFGIYDEIEIKNELTTLVSFVMRETPYVVTIILVDDDIF